MAGAGCVNTLELLMVREPEVKPTCTRTGGGAGTDAVGALSGLKDTGGRGRLEREVEAPAADDELPSSCTRGRGPRLVMLPPLPLELG